ncbi:uncharacterized protein LOC144127800 [Amblyomma americanum]
MELLKPPDHLRLTGNVQKNWELFKQKFELYIQATQSAKPLTEAAKTARLLTAAGDDALEVFNNFTFAEDENKQDYKTVVKKFEEYCGEQQNEVYERYVFRTRTQDEGEPVEHFIRDLRKQARYCNFGLLSDSMIRDQIVFGTCRSKLREKMLREKNLTLQRQNKYARPQKWRANKTKHGKSNEAKVDATEKGYPRRSQGLKNAFQCFKCNRSHEPRKCPAFGKICRACAGRNHFTVCCRKREVAGVQHENEDFEILDVTVCGIQKMDWIVNAQVGGQQVAFKVDTGSQANLLPLSVYNRFRTKPRLRPSNSVLRSYSGNAIMHCGVTTQVVTINDRRCLADFFVVKRGQPILGLGLAESLTLLTRAVDSVTADKVAPAVQQFRHLFEGTGCAKREYRMVLRDDAVPVIHAARRVPLALREPLRKELLRMEKANIICKVDEPTDWDGRSPAELLQGRRLRTRLPDFSQEPKPPVKKRQQQSSGRPLHQLQPGQIVRVRGQAWTQKAKVVEKVAPRSYNIATEEGRTLRRNRQHLLATSEAFRHSSYSDDSDCDVGDADAEEPQHRSSPRATTPATRRSSRTTAEPRRLAYGSNFEQIS